MYNKISVSAEFIFHDSKTLPEVAWDAAFLVQISTCTDSPTIILSPVHLFGGFGFGFWFVVVFFLLKLALRNRLAKLNIIIEVYDQLLYKGSHTFISNTFYG